MIGEVATAAREDMEQCNSSAEDRLVMMIRVGVNLRGVCVGVVQLLLVEWQTAFVD